MIVFIYGTTAEVIKQAPLITRIASRGAPSISICTGQHVDDIARLIDQFALPRPDYWLATGYRGRDLRRNIEVPWWLVRVAGGFASVYGKLRERLSRSEGSSITIVQGDTFTTVLGTLMGFALRTPIGHVEAGVRSFDLRNPFPEEINRRVTSRLAHIHFAPGEIAVGNLATVSGAVINTHFNTVKDSLDLIPDQIPLLESLPSRFGIVSLHRFELINDYDRLLEVLKLLRKCADSVPLLFVDHSITAAKIEQFGLSYLFDESHFIRTPKLRYFEFISLLKRSEFSVTDSGGVQQESFYLNHPCLVHRETVETFDGVGSNVMVSRMDLKAVEDYLADPSRFKVVLPSMEVSPSDVILDYLAREGYV